MHIYIVYNYYTFKYTIVQLCATLLCAALLCTTPLCTALLCTASLCTALLCTTRLRTALLFTTRLCTALLCTTRLCTALLCTTRSCTALLCTMRSCTALLCTTRLRTALLCTTRLCTALLCTKLLYTTLPKNADTTNKVFNYIISVMLSQAEIVRVAALSHIEFRSVSQGISVRRRLQRYTVENTRLKHAWEELETGVLQPQSFMLQAAHIVHKCVKTTKVAVEELDSESDDGGMKRY